MSQTHHSSLSSLTLQGEKIDCVELMDDCTRLLDDPPALREHLRSTGYVYLPGFLGRERVVEARRAFIEALAQAGSLDPAHDPMDGVLLAGGKAPGFVGGRLETLFPDGMWQKVHDVLYAGPMMEFFRILHGADKETLHYDYTWTRQINPGLATHIHSDIVYMGRGTHDLLTAWTPLGDNNFELGGLILLEGSNNSGQRELAEGYWKLDVDAYCENSDDKRDAWQKSAKMAGTIEGSANEIRQRLGAKRWVTHDYKMGDVVIFSIFTVHGGTDNYSNQVRLSTDSRYQRADEPVDERWIGESPPAHGPNGKKGLIC